MKKMILMIGMLVVLLSVMLIACSSNKAEVKYTKEDITLKFKNETGITCYVKISGTSRSTLNTINNVEKWENEISFPSISKTQIPIGGERSITIKDVVVSGKNSYREVEYKPSFNIQAFSDDATHYKEKEKSFYSDSKTTYTGGAFHIKLKEVDPTKGIFEFDIDFIN